LLLTLSPKTKLSAPVDSWFDRQREIGVGAEHHSGDRMHEYGGAKQYCADLVLGGLDAC
jgi:hypothetical protein